MQRWEQVSMQRNPRACWRTFWEHGKAEVQLLEAEVLLLWLRRIGTTPEKAWALAPCRGERSPQVELLVAMDLMLQPDKQLVDFMAPELSTRL